jgi:hypothetical protein
MNGAKSIVPSNRDLNIKIVLIFLIFEIEFQFMFEILIIFFGR